jgi:hypothetical protein
MTSCVQRATEAMQRQTYSTDEAVQVIWSAGGEHLSSLDKLTSDSASASREEQRLQRKSRAKGTRTRAEGAEQETKIAAQAEAAKKGSANSTCAWC